MDLPRRRFLVLLPCAATALLGADTAGVPYRGKLVKGPGDKPALQTSDGKLIFLSGDEDTVGVLKDKRLAGAEFEVIGTLNGDTVAINPIHTAALFVWKDGKRLRVTYWCDVCAIRTYTPGLCWCCREETALDLRDPDTVDKK
jgi:hypothetical protein